MRLHYVLPLTLLILASAVCGFLIESNTTPVLASGDCGSLPCGPGGGTHLYAPAPVSP